MKKILLVVMVLALAIAMVACSAPAEEEASTVEGTTWMMSSLTTPDGVVAEADDLAALLGGEVYYTFEADGVLAAETALGVSEGSWAQEGNEVEVTAEGATVVFVVEGSEMSNETQGAITVFTLVD